MDNLELVVGSNELPLTFHEISIFIKIQIGLQIDFSPINVSKCK